MRNANECAKVKRLTLDLAQSESAHSEALCYKETTGCGEEQGERG